MSAHSGAGMVGDLEQALIAHAKHGDRLAYERLLEPAVRPAARLAFAMLHDRSDAEDAFQESALRAWRRLGNLRPGRPFQAWFLGIVATSPPGGLPPNTWFQYSGPFMFGAHGVFAVSSPAMSEALMYTTSDEGKSWSGPTFESGQSFTAVSPTDWWIVNRGGQVFRTMDAGKTWTAVPVASNYSGLTLKFLLPTNADVLWGIANAAPISGTEISGMPLDGTPLRSTDAGAHWSIVKLP